MVWSEFMPVRNKCAAIWFAMSSVHFVAMQSYSLARNAESKRREQIELDTGTLGAQFCMNTLCRVLCRVTRIWCTWNRTHQSSRN